MSTSKIENVVSLGADPEFFVSQAGKLVSAYGLIEGDKANPTKVKGGAVQVDGMALEFNIDPANNEQQWLGNIDSVLEIIQGMVPQHKMELIPVAEFGLDYIMSQPEKARELGCDPDFNAYTVGINPKPNGERSFRTAAGHIHFGLPEVEGAAPVDDVDYHAYVAGMVRELDFYLAIPSLFFDNDVKRREMYGRAGCFRPKVYGVEYRTLSNQWLATKELRQWAYRASQYAFTQIRKGVCLFDKYGDEIQDVINTSNKEAAIKIVRKEGLMLPEGIHI